MYLWVLQAAGDMRGPMAKDSGHGAGSTRCYFDAIPLANAMEKQHFTGQGVWWSSCSWSAVYGAVGVCQQRVRGFHSRANGSTIEPSYVGGSGSKLLAGAIESGYVGGSSQRTSNSRRVLCAL